MQNSPEQVLKKYWGHNGFRGSQEEIIKSLLANNDVLALMPTGGGKSLCFQLPALVKPGICIVVSPLVALIQNQVDTLKKKGVRAIALTGGKSNKEIDILLDNCIHGNYKFLYLSPERLQQQLVRDRILRMPLNLIAIDEAHCISEWGHDFRPAYRKCSILRELHPNVPIIALTATATAKVAEDIKTNLQLLKSQTFKDSFARKNIAFEVWRRENKKQAIWQLLGKQSGSSIIYVRTRKDSVMLSNFLNEKGEVAAFFHGGLTAFEKKEKLDSWLRDKIRVMVATNAFGMGVDKSDVRTVIHYQLPESVENYYQEAGRAGRDGEPALASLLVNQNDLERAKTQFLDTRPDVPFVKLVYKKLNSFFQIAYGEGENEIHGLRLQEFCQHYNLNPSRTFAVLKLLDQNGILSFSGSTADRTTLLLTSSKEQLFDWISRNSKMGSVLQVLLRTYGGVFDFETKINVVLLSKKTKTNERLIFETLEKLQKDGLAQVRNNTNDMEIVFLLPREDDRTINPISKNIEVLNKTREHKLSQMLGYANNEKTCRPMSLLRYFGETLNGPCGKCDVCKNKLGKHENHEEIKSTILKLLHSKDKTSEELIQMLNFDEIEIIKSIRELLEDEKLILKSKNTYGLN